MKSTFLPTSMAALAAVLVLLASFTAVAQRLSKASAGWLDTRSWDFQSQKLPLNGDWIFFDQQLLTLDQCKNRSGRAVTLPRIWNERNINGRGLGYGTYYLRVIIPSSLEDPVLFIPQLYNSYLLTVNSLPVASNGKVGTTKEESAPQWLPQLAPLQKNSDTLHLVLQISNFHHHIGGIREPLYLGSRAIMHTHYYTAVSASIVQGVLLLTEAIVLMIFFMSFKQKRTILYFALFCLTFGIRVFFSNFYTFTTFYPDINWNAAVRIEYLSIHFAIIWSVLFLSKLFPEVSSKLIKYLICIICVFFIVFTLFTPPLLFTKWLSLYLITAGAALLYGTIVIVRALQHEKEGVWFMVMSVFLIILLMGYDIIAYEGIFNFNQVVLSIGYIIVFTLMTLGLLRHLGIIKSKKSSSTTLTYSDLYQDKNDD
jgi:hypothetical protein